MADLSIYPSWIRAVCTKDFLDPDVLDPAEWAGWKVAPAQGQILDIHAGYEVARYCGLIRRLYLDSRNSRARGHRFLKRHGLVRVANPMSSDLKEGNLAFRATLNSISPGEPGGIGPVTMMFSRSSIIGAPLSSPPCVYEGHKLRFTDPYLDAASRNRPTAEPSRPWILLSESDRAILVYRDWNLFASKPKLLLSSSVGVLSMDGVPIGEVIAGTGVRFSGFRAESGSELRVMVDLTRPIGQLEKEFGEAVKELRRLHGIEEANRRGKVEQPKTVLKAIA
jgi:hypothetical protein